VFGVAAVADAIPQLVVLNEGLALRGEAGWSYLCPALWGDHDAIGGGSTKAQSIDGMTTWTIGDDVYAFDGHRFTPQGQQLLSEFKTSVLAGSASALFALRYDPSGPEIVPVGTSVYQAIWRSSSRWTTLAVDPQSLYVARVDAGMQLALSVLTTAGVERSTQQFTLEIEANNVRLAPLAQGLFAMVENDDSAQLGKLDAGVFQPLATGVRSVLGPVASPNGTLWIAIDGRLQPLPAPGAAPASGPDANCLDLQSRRAEECVTCLGERNGVAYACSAVELYRLDDDGLGDLLFDIRGLKPTPAELVTEQSQTLCGRQWSDFEQDLRANNLAPSDEPFPEAAGTSPPDTGSAVAGSGASLAPPTAPHDRGGCATSGGPAPPGHGPLALLLLCTALSLRPSLGKRRRA
jgi:MYXO-CTERM domain-containing protein